ncbi:unnamed protein product, partial [Hymenolepis diminuta]
EDRLTGVISTKNVCSILAAAIDLKTPPLVESCLAYIFLNAEHIINTTSYQSLCDNRPDVLSFLFRQMACRKKENITALSIESPPASPSLIPCPRAFTFGDSPFKNNSILSAASDLSLTSEVSKQQQQNQSLSIS